MENAAGTGSEFDSTDDSEEKKFVASSLCALIILLCTIKLFILIYAFDICSEIFLQHKKAENESINAYWPLLA